MISFQTNHWTRLHNTLEVTSSVKCCDISLMFKESYPSFNAEQLLTNTIEVTMPVAYRLLQQVCHTLVDQCILDKIPCQKAMELISLIVQKQLQKGGDE